MRKLPKKIQDQVSYCYPGDKYVKRPKYSNRSARCWNKDHAIHQSILEADYCNELNLMKKAGQILDYHTQHKIEIKVNGIHITNHYVDFCVLKTKKAMEFHETKGYATDVWKMKRRLVEALFPGIPYIVKQEKPSFFKGSK